MTVAQYQKVHELNQTTPDTVEQLGWIICALYNKSEAEVNSYSPRKFLRIVSKISKQITAKPSRFFAISLQTDATKITLGQFIECQYWLRDGRNVIEVLDLVAASILIKRTEHGKDADYIRSQPFTKVLPKVEAFVTSMNSLIKNYSGLFELSQDEDEEPEKPHPFITQYGWIFSATAVAEHERITLDQAFDIGIIQALNALAFLKSKQAYEKLKAK